MDVMGSMTLVRYDKHVAGIAFGGNARFDSIIPTTGTTWGTIVESSASEVDQDAVAAQSALQGALAQLSQPVAAAQ